MITHTRLMMDILDSETTKYEIQKTDEPKITWYAVRTFNNMECQLSDYLKSKGLIHFIPMTTGVKTKQGKAHRVLVPVVRNLLFIQRTLSDKELVEVLNDSDIAYNIYRYADSTRYSEISDREMCEFRAFCDPTLKDTRYVSKAEADMKVGREVMIIHGAFKGIRGKLVRYGNDYFMVKTLVGVGVMIHISRWYCKPVKDEK